ncbi:coenzyme F420-0:L-glutamate ligase [Amorphus sp. MBR-141]
MSAPPLTIVALQTLPSFTADHDLAEEILAAARREGIAFKDGDILVVAQKIVSKVEGRLRRLSDYQPSDRALALADETGKDPRFVEAVLSESAAVIRTRPGVIIVEHRLGHIMANAGIDRSNIGGSEDALLLLPRDPDGSAAALRAALVEATGARIGVIVSDSFGRPWRIGTTGIAIGTAGPAMVVDRRGEPDRDGRPLQVTEIGFADTVAAAAVLVMGEGSEGRPAVIVRGLDWPEAAGGTRSGLRPAEQDLFR